MTRPLKRDDFVCAACRLVRSDLIGGKCRNCTEKAKSQAAHDEPDLGFWFWMIVLIAIILTEPLRERVNCETD